MRYIKSEQSSGIEPIYISVEEAAKALGGISRWVCYQLLNSGAIESRYQGRRRLVSVSSLRAYAASLPTSRPGDDDDTEAS
jgi:excisionase family DNA binding protein